jgi:hypothetical protein
MSVEPRVQRHVRRAGAWVAGALIVLAVPAAAQAQARVLRVGTYHGKRGQFRTIQAAVDHARPGDWILVGPGDYHERADHRNPPAAGSDVPPSGVLIRTRRLHVRGMSRNRVVVDGTKPGAGRPCSPAAARQDFGIVRDGTPQGRNGVVVWKAGHVTVENLTVCNFLTGDASSGNEIWWNGGDGSGTIGLGAFRGAYLNATSTFYGGEDTAAAYGLFSSNSDGPGVFAHTYASNFNDGGYYIGACRRVCNQVIDHGWAQYNALGYSGTNSGGRLIVENSEFDHNQDGFDTNSQNNDDFPSPQDGRCPGTATSPITHSASCWVFMHNFVHDNNNPDVPKAGSASQGPVGTGMSIAGGRFDTVMDNRFVHNGAWGLLIAPYPDDETPPPGQHCQGGSSTDLAAFGFDCTFDVWGNQVFDNTFSGNGFFGNPTNGDIGELTLESGHPIDCFRGNTVPDGTSPPTLQQTNGTCGRTGTANGNLALLTEAACDSGVLPAVCLPTDRYPQATGVVMHPLPTPRLASMPRPCAGVPGNPWCGSRAAARQRRPRRRVSPVLTG